jgi:hypothetical protein
MKSYEKQREILPTSATNHSTHQVQELDIYMPILYISFTDFVSSLDDIKMRGRKRISTDETEQFANIISWKQTSG